MLRHKKKENKKECTARNPCAAFSVQGCLDSVDRPVDNLTAQQPAFQLPPQQAAFSLGALHEAAVLLGSAGQVRDDFVHGAVGNILIDGKSCLTWFKHSTETQWITLVKMLRQMVEHLN